MFQVGDKIRINSIPGVISARAVNAIRNMSLETLKEMSLDELGSVDFHPVDFSEMVRVYNLVTRVQTIEEICDDEVDGEVYVQGDDYYMNFNDIEKVEKEPVSKRISIKELRGILCSK